GQSSLPFKIFSLRSMAGQVLTTLQAILPPSVSFLRAVSQISTLQPCRACDSRYKRSANSLSMSVRERGSSSALTKPRERHTTAMSRDVQMRKGNTAPPPIGYSTSLADGRADIVAAPLLWPRHPGCRPIEVSCTRPVTAAAGLVLPRLVEFGAGFASRGFSAAHVSPVRERSNARLAWRGNFGKELPRNLSR